MKQENEKLGLGCLVVFVVLGPAALAGWLYSLGWLFTAWHWAVLCFKG